MDSLHEPAVQGSGLAARSGLGCKAAGETYPLCPFLPIEGINDILEVATGGCLQLYRTRTVRPLGCAADATDCCGPAGAALSGRGV